MKKLILTAAIVAASFLSFAGEGCFTMEAFPRVGGYIVTVYFSTDAHGVPYGGGETSWYESAELAEAMVNGINSCCEPIE